MQVIDEVWVEGKMESVLFCTPEAIGQALDKAPTIH